MFEVIFIDLPVVLVGYAGVVFVILKYLGDTVHDVGAVAVKHEVPASSESMRLVVEKVTREIQLMEREDAVESALPAPDEIVSEIYPDFLPTDVQLKRHYLTHLFTIATTLHPRPEEATLRRHHRQRVICLVEEMLEHPETIDAIEALAREKSRLDTPVVHIVGDASQVPSLDFSVIDDGSCLQSECITLPQENTLRRHFIQQLLAKVELVFPRPTESTLRRHYDQWLESQVVDLVLHHGS